MILDLVFFCHPLNYTLTILKLKCLERTGQKKKKTIRRLPKT